MLTKKDLQAISELIDTKINPKFKKLREEIIKFKDEILGEIKELRDDVSVVTGYKDQIKDHETRIERLEKRSRISP